MDVPVLSKGLDFSRRNKKWLLLIAAFGASGYGAYKVYHLPSVARKRIRLMKLLRAFVSLSELVSDSAETISIVSKDLNQFLNSDSDEIPNSLKQLSKIATSKEFSGSLSRVSQAITLGILLGHKSQASNGKISEIGADPNDFTDRVLDRLFSKAGTGFVSVVVGSFARNLVLGFCSAELMGDKLNAQSKASDVPGWVNLICDERCGKLIGNLVQIFVSTAVAVFLDRTMDVNSFDEMFAGMTNPKHQEKVQGVLVSMCNGAVETFVRTSHQVLTKSSVKSNSTSYVSSLVLKGNGPIINEDGCLEPAEPLVVKHSGLGGPAGGTPDAGLLGQIKSTMSVPANRRYVIDLTGRVTMEAMKSFVALLLWRISDGLKRGMRNVHDEAVDKGFEVVRYVGAKSSVILTMCVAFYLHILGGSSIVLSA